MNECVSCRTEPEGSVMRVATGSRLRSPGRGEGATGHRGSLKEEHVARWAAGALAQGAGVVTFERSEQSHAFPHHRARKERTSCTPPLSFLCENRGLGGKVFTYVLECRHWGDFCDCWVWRDGRARTWASNSLPVDSTALEPGDSSPVRTHACAQGESLSSGGQAKRRGRSALSQTATVTTSRAQGAGRLSPGHHG